MVDPVKVARTLVTVLAVLIALSPSAAASDACDGAAPATHGEVFDSWSEYDGSQYIDYVFSGVIPTGDGWLGILSWTCSGVSNPA